MSFLLFHGTIVHQKVDVKESRYMLLKAFETKDKAAEGMSDIFRAEMASQNLGVTFEDAELDKHVGERIQEIAHENPEKLNLMFSALNGYKNTMAEIAELEGRVAEMSDKRDLEDPLTLLRKKEETLETAQEVSGFFARKFSAFLAAFEQLTYGYTVEHAKEWLSNNDGEPAIGSRAEMETFVHDRSQARRLNDARITVENEYNIKIDPASIEAELDKVRAEISHTEQQIEAADFLKSEQNLTKNRMLIMRNFLVRSLETNGALKKLAVEKVQEKLYKLIDSDPAEAYEFFKDVETASEDNAFEIDYFGPNRDEILEDIQEQVEVAVKGDIRTTIESTRLGSRSFDRMVTSLKEYMDSNKVAAKQGPEARAFFINALKSIAKEVSSKNKAKGLLLRAAIVKLSSTK